MLKKFCFIIIVFFFHGSCIKEQTSPSYPIPSIPQNCDTSVINYAQIIRPLILTNCNNAAATSCHYSGTGNYDFGTYAVVADRIRSGRFTERILLPVNNPLHMPPFGEMNPCDKAKLLLWINNGFPEN
ncbi:MAG: hypothetical protein JJE25_05305 [Bacteroidia bacterium]|nr:hypothetical protein [Bacteroidia bacterium]